MTVNPMFVQGKYMQTALWGSTWAETFLDADAQSVYIYPIHCMLPNLHYTHIQPGLLGMSLVLQVFGQKSKNNLSIHPLDFENWPGNYCVIYPRGNMNVCSKFNGSLSKGYPDISFKITNVILLEVLGEKFRKSAKWIGFLSFGIPEHLCQMSLQSIQ